MSGRTETVDLDVSGHRSNHVRSIQAVHWNLVTTDGKLQEFGHSPTHHLYIHQRAFRSFQPSHDVLRSHLHTRNQRVVHFHDAVSCQDAHLFRRPSRHRLNHEQGILRHVELDTDTVEIPLQGFIHAFHFFGSGISGMRIQFFQHAFDGTLHQLPFVRLVHIQIGYRKLGQLQLTDGVGFSCVLLLLRLQTSHRKNAGKQACNDVDVHSFHFCQISIPSGRNARTSFP